MESPSELERDKGLASRDEGPRGRRPFEGEYPFRRSALVVTVTVLIGLVVAERRVGGPSRGSPGQASSDADT
jgi:hypothetical protein